MTFDEDDALKGDNADGAGATYTAPKIDVVVSGTAAKLVCSMGDDTDEANSGQRMQMQTNAETLPGT